MEQLAFEELFRKIKKITKGKNQKGVAQALGVSPQAITDAKRKNKIPETWFGIIEEKYDLSKDDLILYECDLKKRVGETDVGQISSGEKREKDSYDHIMDEFFELVKEWHGSENGRSSRSAIGFIQEFPHRFKEMALWQKKRKEGEEPALAG